MALPHSSSSSIPPPASRSSKHRNPDRLTVPSGMNPAAVASVESLSSCDELDEGSATKQMGSNDRAKRTPRVSFLDEGHLDEKDHLHSSTNKKSFPRKALKGIGGVLGFCAYILFYSCVLSGEVPKKQQQQATRRRGYVGYIDEFDTTIPVARRARYPSPPRERRPEGSQMGVIIEGEESGEEERLMKQPTISEKEKL